MGSDKGVLPSAAADTVLPRPCSAPAYRLRAGGAIRLVLQAPPWQSAACRRQGAWRPPLSPWAPSRSLLPPRKSLSVSPFRGGPRLYAQGTLLRRGLTPSVPGWVGGVNLSAPTPAALHTWALNSKAVDRGRGVTGELLGKSDSVSTYQERKGNGAPAYYTTFILQVEK